MKLSRSSTAVTARAVPADTRERLLAAAAMIAEGGGYSAVTMQNIAAAAGFSRITVYKYFANRDEALAEIAIRWGVDMLNVLGNTGMNMPAGGRAYRRLSAVIRQAQQKPRLINAVLQALVSGGDKWNELNYDTVRRYLGFHTEATVAPNLPQIVRSFGYILHILLLSTCAGTMTVRDALSDLAFIVERFFPGTQPRAARKPAAR